MPAFFTFTMVFILIVIVVGAVTAAYVISKYNKLVALKARFENAFAQIEVQLTRRYDLIPNIVEAAKGYMKHETETLTKVIEARNSAASSLQLASAHPADADSIAALNKAEGSLAGSLGGFRLQVEAYPELKASTVMVQLNEELASTENRVAFARQAFNDAVTLYNIQRNTFPANVVAAFFGHTKDALLLDFGNSGAIQDAPRVSF